MFSRIAESILALGVLNVAGWFAAPTIAWAILRFDLARTRDVASDPTAPRAVLVSSRMPVVVASLAIVWVAFWSR